MALDRAQRKIACSNLKQAKKSSLKKSSRFSLLDCPADWVVKCVRVHELESLVQPERAVQILVYVNDDNQKILTVHLVDRLFKLNPPPKKLHPLCSLRLECG